MKSETLSTFAAGVMTGVVASFAIYLTELRRLSAEVSALQREVDDLIRPERPPRYEREREARTGDRPAPEPGTAPVTTDAYEAQIRRREVGRGRPEERGDFDMVD